MTNGEKTNLLNELLEYEENNDIGNLTRAERREFQQWISEALEQEPKTDKYEYHIDHTDCIWYGSDSGCPTTCSQYRDGWNDAMKYIFKDGKGLQATGE